jgi:hypothetical protein
MARRHRPVAFELLESRHLLSGNSSLAHFISSAVAGGAPATGTDIPTSDSAQPARQPVASTAASTRWDWLANTTWYVPTENLLAYTTGSDLSDPQPVADQTVWYITQCENGQFAGETVVKLSSNPVPLQMQFTGIVTAGGQIRMEFVQSEGAPPTTGIGQMRFVDGAWRVEMQMATGSNSLVTHWAYMSELPSNTNPPDPTDTAPPGSLRSDNWRWLRGTHWSLTDSQLFGDATHVGVFEIDQFHNGYFWGSGTSGQPFSVLGSITPEGNVLLLVSVDGAAPQARTGFLSDGTIPLRTYEGNPAIGAARLLGGSETPSARHWMSSAAGTR